MIQDMLSVVVRCYHSGVAIEGTPYVELLLAHREQVIEVVTRRYDETTVRVLQWIGIV